MTAAAGATTDAESTAGGPRRSVLAQDRSRRTREALADAALELWTERGFETGIETTTVEEIARAAGVTKGTFYFHFARKVDVLLELNTAIDYAMTATARQTLEEGQPVEVALSRALEILAERNERLSRAAMAQILREYHRSPMLARERSAFRTVLPELLTEAQARGELPLGTNLQRLADLLAGSMVAVTAAWTEGRLPRLAPELQHALHVLFAGVRAVDA